MGTANGTCEGHQENVAEILSAGDVARYLHCSKAHVYNAINGRIDNVSPLPALCLGRRRLVRRTALEAWIRTNERGLVSAMMPRSQKRAPLDA